ncbi:hypothetical protein G6F56_003776 [Rhizopus delemar]|nr:hypothetical protein G6F56_003776 [Rhizopus delemar]
MSSLPDQLIIVPLENEVVLPSVVIKICLRGKDATTLAHQHMISSRQRSSTYIACIPMITATTDSLQENLFDYGCTAKILRVERASLGAFTMHIEGVARFKTLQIKQENAWMAQVSYFEEQEMSNHDEDIIQFRALVQTFLDRIKELQMPENLLDRLTQLLDSVSSSNLADLLVTVIEVSFNEKLTMLSTLNTRERIGKASDWIKRQLHMIKISEKVHSSMGNKLPQKQKEFYLRQQLEAIKKELGEPVSGEKEGEIDILERKLQESELPQEVQIVVQREIQRLKKLQPTSSEYSVSRSYLELLADLPWNAKTEDMIDIQRAKEELDSDHFGLDYVKKRIVEYLSVMKIKGDIKAPILCFLGPPGVGKTSLGKSIATSLGREFHRISLGGVRDEADVRGHRRTYVGSMPGLIIQGLRKCKVNNPLFLLDEIDKLSHSSHYGNPAAALLEVLDPEQNDSFSDHYLNVPFDLSNVLFIATANSIETIPEALLDRMEIISLNGYTFEEKLFIAKSHLLPKQLSIHGLAQDAIRISDETLLKVAENYTRESGVRSLERTIASIVRAKCVEWAALNDSGEYEPDVTLSDVQAFLGSAVYGKEVAEREAVPGVVTGLAYSASGNGGILFVESTKVPGHGQLILTGSLGDVIKESGKLALTWVKAHAYSLKMTPSIESDIMDKCDIHIHVPGGAVPKDGPSAGVTLVTSLVSLFSGYHVPTTTAMTGEISLRGQVLPVGGIKEKVVSAHRAGILKIILPFRNRKDVEQDVPEKLKKEIEFVFAKNIWEVLEAALMMSKSEKWTTRIYESHL